MGQHFAIGTSFGWRHPIQRGEASDIVRVTGHGALTLVALANAFDSGFSVCWPPGSRLILDAFERSWAKTNGATKERLAQAFEGTRRRFMEHATALIPDDADFPDGQPGATLLVAAFSEARVQLAWIGVDVAIHSRGMTVIDATRPHSFQDRGDLPEDLRHLIRRSIGVGAPDQDPPETAAFNLEGGDVVVLVSGAGNKSRTFIWFDAAFADDMRRSPKVASQTLVETAFAVSDAPYSAAVVVKVL